MIFLIFYADVYFLINFTVDTIALYFAAAISKIPTSVRRILLLSVLGAALATVSVIFADGAAGELLLSFIYFFAVAFFAAADISFYRRVKVTVIFAVFEFLIGGFVAFGYGILDRCLYTTLKNTDADAPNRNLLLLCVMVLLSIGVFKLLILFFSNTATQRCVRLEIQMLGKITVCEALIDTGNLLKEPNGMKPVILIKPDIAAKIHKAFPKNCEDLKNIDECFLNRISLIPISTVGGRGVLVGVAADKIDVIFNNKNKIKHTISAIIASDKEGGTYDGSGALLPASALDGIK